MSRSPASTPRRLLWSRWLVLALLSLTLPLQGALAATMGIGMALMSSHAGAVVMAMPSDCQDMDMSAMAHDPGDMHGMEASVHASGDDASAAADDDHAAASDHHCGICLQCCIGAAMPIAPLTPAAHDPRDVAPSLDAHGAPEQSPRPLERPPKVFLA